MIKGKYYILILIAAFLFSCKQKNKESKHHNKRDTSVTKSGLLKLLDYDTIPKNSK